MPIYGAIFRLDFEPVYEIFDSPGKIMKELHTKKIAKTLLLPDLLEQNDKRIITARFVSKIRDEMRSLSVEPISIHGTFETVDGVEIERLNDYNVFTKLVQLVDTFRQDYNINNLFRCGLRLFIFDTIGNKDGHSSIDKTKDLIDRNLTDDFQKIFGNIKDVGIAFDGTSEDDISYKFKCGPYSTKGFDKHLSVTNELFDKNTNHDFIADVDIFEKNFRLRI
ncbi:MAG: hypothetical protein RBR67_21180 [Desulfobacterium sp.]|nr:hypothetical protein [Desulfobacterium sp.]